MARFVDCVWCTLVTHGNLLVNEKQKLKKGTEARRRPNRACAVCRFNINALKSTQTGFFG